MKVLIDSDAYVNSMDKNKFNSVKTQLTKEGKSNAKTILMPLKYHLSLLVYQV